jgi:hypothetical protein
MSSVAHPASKSDKRTARRFARQTVLESRHVFFFVVIARFFKA